MASVASIDFHHAQLLAELQTLDAAGLDAVDFGIIGFDETGMVRLYNEVEARLAGLSPGRVLGAPLFTVVAPCMNNFMVAHRFEQATAGGQSLDVTIDYVLTLRMRPVKVKLRLLAAPGVKMRYVLVLRGI